MNFYDLVTEDNAILWYSELPPHLKKTIEDKQKKFKNGRECTRHEVPALYEQVTKELGTRPLKPAEPADPLDGWNAKQMAQYEKLKKWAARYDEKLLIALCVESAPAMQRERRLLNEAMGLNVDASDLPSQADGLEPTVAATVRWLQESGEMPLEYLARTYRSDDAKTSDRITAARTLMDYVHRKIPQKQEVETKAKVPQLDTSVMSALSKKELETLVKLLGKLEESE